MPNKYVYLFALAPFCLIWATLFLIRKDLRKEMLLVGIFIGLLSVLTSYFWWTIDWWRPATITGTIVGVEDFLMGFTAGGIMSVIYKVIRNDSSYNRYKFKFYKLSTIILMLFMAGATTWLTFVIGLTTFWSSLIAMLSVALFIMYVRRDLIVDSVVSGLAMMIISISFYLVASGISNTWVNSTYLHGLSGARVANIPIEEFVFWFLAGMWVGPIYEYALGKKLRRKKTKK